MGVSMEGTHKTLVIVFAGSFTEWALHDGCFDAASNIVRECYGFVNPCG